MLQTLLGQIVAMLVIFLITPHVVNAQEWYYPMTQYDKRLTVKDFGLLVNDQFYQGKEQLFPFNRFYGYHAGVDLETLPGESEQKVPIYAVKKGRIIYVGSLEGYGGVILQSLEGESLTALYGHVKITNLPYKVGGEILSGKVVTYLGDEFSSETSRERKHLHFAIYKGKDLYFRGHESRLEKLNNRWINPNVYLKEKEALMPAQSPSASPSIASSKAANSIIEIAKRILESFGFRL